MCDFEPTEAELFEGDHPRTEASFLRFTLLFYFPVVSAHMCTRYCRHEKGIMARARMVHLVDAIAGITALLLRKSAQNATAKEETPTLTGRRGGSFPRGGKRGRSTTGPSKTPPSFLSLPA